MNLPSPSLPKSAQRWCRITKSRFPLLAFIAALAGFVLSSPSVALDVKSLPMPKGEQVWYVSDHTLPLIAMAAALPAGSAYDPAEKAGLANFAAQLVDEGSGTMRAGDFQAALANRGIRLTATVERDWLIISVVTLSKNAKDAFTLLGQALAHPRFDSDAIARVRAQILADIEEQDEDPQSAAEKGFYQAFFGNHPYAHSAAGTARTIATINGGDLRRFAAAHWVLRGLKVAISGDVDESTLAVLVKSGFGSLSMKISPALPAVSHYGKAGISVVPMTVPQPNAVFGLPGMLRSDPEYMAGFVANYIVGGGGFASRLTGEVREKRGLTYDVSTSLESLRKSGLVLGEVATKRGGMTETIGVIRDSLRDFAQNGPTDKELADAKTYLTGSFPLSFSSNLGTADQLSTFQRVGLPLDYVQNRNALINAVTLDQVRRAAKRLFDPSRLTVVVAGSYGRPQPGNPRSGNQLVGGRPPSSLH